MARLIHNDTRPGGHEGRKENDMTLKDLSPVLRSRRDNIQTAIIWDEKECRDLENGCSVEYAIKEYGDRPVKRIEAFENNLLITV